MMGDRAPLKGESPEISGGHHSMKRQPLGRWASGGPRPTASH